VAAGVFLPGLPWRGSAAAEPLVHMIPLDDFDLFRRTLLMRFHLVY
jgi:hypothetical protein